MNFNLKLYTIWYGNTGTIFAKSHIERTWSSENPHAIQKFTIWYTLRAKETIVVF